MRALRNMLLILGFFIANGLFAASVDTVMTYSAAMKKNIKAVVITPANYKTERAFPVVYLLHGYGDNYARWIKEVPRLTTFADEMQVMLVCPDGGIGSWYWDSPIDSNYRYETYISKELVQWVDANYKTIKDRKGRAITGLSMGGHGGLFLGFRHQDVYGACGSMSGGVDIRPFPENWDIAKRLGAYAQHPDNWDKLTVINQLYLLTPKSISIIIDCGIDDFFYKANENLHEQLVQRNIPHDFITRPGQHNWPYWHNAIQYQLIYFKEYFTHPQE